MRWKTPRWLRPRWRQKEKDATSQNTTREWPNTSHALDVRNVAGVFWKARGLWCRHEANHDAKNTTCQDWTCRFDGNYSLSDSQKIEWLQATNDLASSSCVIIQTRLFLVASRLKSMLQETTVTEQWQALSCLVFCATTQLAQQWQRETCKEDLCLADFGTRCSDDDVELLSAMGAVLSSLCTRQFNSSRSQERSSHLENFARFEQSNGKLKDKLAHHLYSVNPAQSWLYLILYIVFSAGNDAVMRHDPWLFHFRNQQSIIDQNSIVGNSRPTIFTPPILSKSHRPSKGDPRKLPANSR